MAELGNKMEKTGMPSGSRVKWHGKNTEILLATVGRKFVGPRLIWGWGWLELQGTTKRVFSSMVMARQCKNDIGPLQDEDSHFTNRHMDKTWVFSAFFGSLFNMDDGPREFQCPEMVDHDCVND